jgi:hypothetical protein
MYADDNDQKIVNACTVENTEGHNDNEGLLAVLPRRWNTEQRIQGSRTARCGITSAS